MLGRTNYDIDFLRLNKNYSTEEVNKNIELFIIKGNNIIYKKHDKLKIEFLTVHKAKGLEADNVIIFNMKNDKLGFPNRIADDPVLQLLLPTEDNFAFAEERRLFYVALTRTRNKTLLLVPDHNASEFANEIKSKSYLEIPDGKNIIINNPKCPDCGGFLVVRKGVNGQFLGCTNYPNCKHTAQIHDTKMKKNEGK